MNAPANHLDIREVLHPQLLRARIAMVTGAGSGLGRAIAIDLAKLGSDVVLAGRRTEPLEETAAAVREAGSRALVIPTDIRDEEEVTAMVDRALDEFGRIDVLVNNAGGQFIAPAEEITPKGWRAVHRLAVDGSWTVTQQVAVKSMIPNRSGVVFFMAFSPRRGIPGMVHATSARAALENLAAGLSLEWSRFGIRSICVAPGTIVTEGLRENYSDADRAGWAQGVPLGRLGEPSDVSALVGFLASPAAAYVTGTTVVVDGGTDAWGTGRPVPTLEMQITKDSAQ